LDSARAESWESVPGELGRKTEYDRGGVVMGLSANEFRKLAQNCIQEAEANTDADGKQMLLDIARLYNQTALHIETGQASTTGGKIVGRLSP
jgi:hypothetical protein